MAYSATTTREKSASLVKQKGGDRRLNRSLLASADFLRGLAGEDSLEVLAAATPRGLLAGRALSHKAHLGFQSDYWGGFSLGKFGKKEGGFSIGFH